MQADQARKAAEWLGVNRPPSREYAMAHVARSKVSYTGREFGLHGGRKIPMPPGEDLRKPEGCADWNDRYFFHVAEVLGDEIAAEVDAFRLPPPDFANDLNAVATLEAEIERRGWMDAYTDALWFTWKRDGGLPYFNQFLIRDTAAQRLAAVGAVIEQMEGK